MLRPEAEYGLVCGIDEAGRGPLAGPVCAAAVILPEEYDLPGLNDSKKLSPKARDVLYDRILKTAIAWGVGWADEKEIDGVNILQATFRAMSRALEGLDRVPDHAFVDGNKRIGMYVLLTFLETNGIRLELTDKDISGAGLAVADGSMKYEDLLHWIRSHEKL